MPRTVVGFLVGSVVLAIAGVATMRADAKPSPFELMFEARHVTATIPSNSGLMHSGSFTASAPFCSVGTVNDVRFERSSAVHRLYTCGDGTGAITVRSTIPLAEHDATGDGAWSIVDGSGQYASLRGKGRWESVRLGGDPASAETVTFRSTARGIADLDADGPSIEVTQLKAAKARSPIGSYMLRLGLSLQDLDGNAVTWRVTVASGSRQLALRTGVAASGPVALTLRLRPPKAARTLRLSVVAVDPLDNARSIGRTIPLPR